MRPARSRLCPVVVGFSLVLGFGCERGATPSLPAEAPAAPPVPVAPPVEPTPPRIPAAEPPEPHPDQLDAIAGMRYLEVVTGGAAPDAALPMIIAFHGNTAYPGLMAWALLDKAGPRSRPAAPYTSPARFIFPLGVDAYGGPGHARWFSVTANQAQESPQELAKLSAQIQKVTQTLAPAIEALTQARPTQGKPIVTGHSQGGILTFALVVAHPELFAAAIPAAGWLPEPLWPKQVASGAAASTPILALHGDADTVVNYAESKRGVQKLDQLGYAIEEHSYPEVQHVFGPLLAELRERLETLAAEQSAAP